MTTQTEHEAAVMMCQFGSNGSAGSVGSNATTGNKTRTDSPYCKLWRLTVGNTANMSDHDSKDDESAHICDINNHDCNHENNNQNQNVNNRRRFTAKQYKCNAKRIRVKKEMMID
jgi:hypothetical protein